MQFRVTSVEGEVDMADSSSTVEDSEELTSDEDFDEDYIHPYNFESILSDTDTKNTVHLRFSSGKPLVTTADYLLDG